MSRDLPYTSYAYLSLANQEVLRWQLEMQKEVGSDITHDTLKSYLWKTLKSGQVVPGYGHGVLRSTDPRFTAFMNFIEARPELMKSPTIKLVKMVRRVRPLSLGKHSNHIQFSRHTKSRRAS